MGALSLYGTAVVLVLLLCSAQLRALNPTTSISTYAHTAWRVQDGLLSATSTAITQTRDGYIWVPTENLWVASSCGLARFKRAKVQEWWSNPQFRQPNRLVLCASDGFGSTVAFCRPRASLASDGRLWFAGHAGLLVLDPAHLALNPLPPPVYVEELIANHQRIALAADLQLPVRTQDLEIDYTAFSFLTPQKELFRYKLDGRDRDWQDAGTRRQAFYSDLSPGNNTFHVIACNNSGVWNEQGAALHFTIPPAWYQTLWFKVLSAAISVCLLRLFILFRDRRVEREVRFRLEAQMWERMRIARELHDTLLQSLQGLILSVSSFSSQASAPPRVFQEMESALDRAEDILVSGRDRIRELRSDSVTGRDLESELNTLIERADRETGRTIELHVIGKPRQLKSQVQEETLWVIREALANACQHSGGTKILLHVSRASIGLRCVVQDNGIGMQSQSALTLKIGHYGVIGMRERAERIGARFQIDTTPGTGTELTLFVPARIAYEDNSNWIARLFSWV